MAPTARLSTRFSFEAAHRMPAFPAGHPNFRIHGHSYTGEVVIEGPIDPHSGFVMSHSHLLEAVNGVTQRLDHYFLNDIPGLETPSGENIARWIWRELKPRLPLLCEIVVERETCGIRISYRGQE